MSVERALQDAAAALAPGGAGGRTALGHLAAAWRELPAREIASLADELSPRLLVPKLPPCKTRKAQLAAWIERARALDPADWEVLRLGLWQAARPSELVPMIDELIHRAGDPRIGGLVCELMERLIRQGQRQPRLWVSLGALVIAARDAQVTTWAHELVRQSRAYTAPNDSNELPGVLARQPLFLSELGILLRKAAKHQLSEERSPAALPAELREQVKELTALIRSCPG